MAALSGDFTDQTVLIYDLKGNHLGSTSINSHDRRLQQIQVNLLPDELKINDDCKLLVLSSPIPCEYMGKIKKSGGSIYIAMFQGQERESRGSARYPVNTPALVDALIMDNKVHNLQTPIKINLINISTTGVRFRAPFYSFEVGDIFQMYLSISNNNKRMTARVINHKDNEPSSSDYGCSFIQIGQQ